MWVMLLMVIRCRCSPVMAPKDQTFKQRPTAKSDEGFLAKPIGKVRSLQTEVVGNSPMKQKQGRLD
jgi:hypothetical protein